MISEISC